MYMIVIPEKTEKSKWFANGGNLVIKALKEGELVDSNTDDFIEPILPDFIKEGLLLNFNKPYKFYKGARYKNCEIEENLLAGRRLLISKEYDIQTNDQWGLFEDYVALEIKRLCMRIKAWESCPLRFVPTGYRGVGDGMNGLLIMLVFNDYEAISYKERSLLYENSIMTNNQGVFVMLNTIFNYLIVNDKAFYKIVRQAKLRSFNDFEWKRYKYSQD